jgi:hypothetical protein
MPEHDVWLLCSTGTNPSKDLCLLELFVVGRVIITMPLQDRRIAWRA